MNFITGLKFKILADFVFSTTEITREGVIPRGDYRYLINTLDTRRVRDGDIIYTHSFYAEHLFKKSISKKYILITHNSDLNIDFAPPDNVTWYTTNVNIRHERVRSIPIGLENDRWYPEKRPLILEKLKAKKDFRNMVYVNHNTGTNPDREEPYRVMDGQKWATVERGRNGQNISNYFDNIYNHPFVICPEGNGIDTHRVWECLYLNTVPVVRRNINTEFYKDLPICFVDSWDEVTEMFLFEEYKRMAKVKWNLDKLNFDYWKNVASKRT